MKLIILIHLAMIKLIYAIIFCLLLPQSSYSQNLIEIEQSNVVFVSYDSSLESVEKTVYRKGVNFENNYSMYNYYFIAANGNIDRSYPLRFVYFGPQATSQSKYMYFKAHKKFVKKNKNRIITKEFMSSIGLEKTKEILNNAKAIFLIDDTEIKDCKILVKQVVFHDILNI